MTIGQLDNDNLTNVELALAAASDLQRDDTTGDDQRTTADDATQTPRSRIRRALSHWPLLVIGLLLVAAATGSATLYFGQYRHDQQTNDATANSVISAATEGTVALLSYTPDKVESDLAGAKSHLTGDFLTYYSKFADKIVAPAAKQKAVNTQAAVKRAVISELHPDTARVLVFLDQTTTSKDQPEPVQTASSVMVSMTKSHGTWLISAFDPI
ncbi:twin-arginine translocation pathway signal [Mycobacterium scrofulaceum]|uniref:twin-arginine translocation pathway signal n=1 Tax=Mycobacterium scrofulaceum TaxID=1783 RepID=UPI000A7F8B2E|nr:twin-arginine translocation pathway signal [Mycobacterium scrofulaceum]